MKKDIQIEQVEDIKLAVIREYNKTSDENEWSVFLINQKETAIEMIIALIKGFNDTQETTTFRRKINQIPPHCSMKLELIQAELFELNNQFQISFFEGSKMQEINFIFPANTIDSSKLVDIPDLGARGIFAEQF